MTSQLLEVYQSLFKSLWDRMSMMLGKFATYSLIERALFETTRTHPLVELVALQDNELNLDGLEEKMNDESTEAVREAMNTLVVNLVGGLAEQVGKQMAERIAGKAVPPDEK